MNHSNDGEPVRSLEAQHYLMSVELLRERVESFSEYPFCLPAVRNLGRLEFHRAVTFLVGENGSGKSTLLEGVAVAWRAESFYNVATEIERLDQSGGPGPPLVGAYGGRSLHEQSHGESFMSLVFERFRGNGLYLLDEPEAALSPSRQLALLARIHQLVLHGSQFIIATHSPLLLAFPDASILSLEPDGIRESTYEETEHFAVTRRFLQDHRSMLRQILGEDGTE